jgi:hypothetical protein
MLQNGWLPSVAWRWKSSPALLPGLLNSFLLGLFGLPPALHPVAPAQDKQSSGVFGWLRQLGQWVRSIRRQAPQSPAEPVVEAPAVEPVAEAPSESQSPLGVRAAARAKREAKHAEIDALTAEFLGTKCARITGEETFSKDLYEPLWLPFLDAKGISRNRHSRKAWSLSMQRQGLGKDTSDKKGDKFIGVRPRRAAPDLRVVSNGRGLGL